MMNNNDDRANNKKNFWERLTRVTEAPIGEVFIMGDFNARVGKDKLTMKGIIDTHGEEFRNDKNA